MLLFLKIFIFFGTFHNHLVFAAKEQKITVASHNLHGHGQLTYHQQCIQNYPGIWMAQETWLSEAQIPRLKELGVQYVARSGMEHAVSTSILRGRPFGGVSIAWSPELNHLISPLTNYKHGRVVGVELDAGETQLLFITVYMPYFNASRRDECIVETIEVISMLETILADHPNHLTLIGGDFNTELNGSSPFDDQWKEFAEKKSLAFCRSSFSPSAFTYHHESLDQKKFIDHFLVSKKVIDSGKIGDFKILEDADNFSDHLPILLSISIPISSPNKTTATDAKKLLNWKKVSDEKKLEYKEHLESLVYRTRGPVLLPQCAHRCGCSSDSCQCEIQTEYESLISCIKTASKTLPRFKPGVEKEWWTSELTELKNKSIEIQRLWVNEGRPRQGPTHTERLHVRASYRHALRKAKLAPKQEVWNRLHESMVTKDSSVFWNKWRTIYNKNKNGFSPVVGGFSTKAEIATTFKDTFQANSKPNSNTKVEELDAKFRSDYSNFCDKHKASCDCNPSSVSLHVVIDAICGMKCGKSADDDELSAEHFHNAPLNLLVRLTSLFNFMLNHAFVPSQFRSCFMIPVIKDRQGDQSDPQNYRGISISPIITKIFEHVLKLTFCDYLVTSQHQYGFKQKRSTTHALFCLRQTVSYYINNGSRVFCSFLDASKAFDRLVHSGLYIKLMARNIPKAFLDIIISWYDGLLARVKWDGVFSDWFSITAGVRQGGVLSPDLYCIYVDDLLLKLEKCGIGCYLRDVFAAALFYADDMALMAPSVKGLQRLLDIVSSFCVEWDICLNPQKTKNIFFGRKCESLIRLTLDERNIEWVEQCKYLGINLKSGKNFGCSVGDRVKKFYRCSNAILRIEGKSDEMTMLKLLETHCIPVLTYGIEVIFVSDQTERRKLRVAYNSIYRRLFSYRTYESVTTLQGFIGKPTWEQLIERSRNNFKRNILSCPVDSLLRVAMAANDT